MPTRRTRNIVGFDFPVLPKRTDQQLLAAFKAAQDEGLVRIDADASIALTASGRRQASINELLAALLHNA